MRGTETTATDHYRTPDHLVGRSFLGSLAVRLTRAHTHRAHRAMERVAVTPALLLALLIAIAYSADRTALSSQVAHLSS